MDGLVFGGGEADKGAFGFLDARATSAQKVALQKLAMAVFAKNELGAARLEICNDPLNEKSRRVAERCGFVLEGILRQNFRAPGGSLRDSCMYALVLT